MAPALYNRRSLRASSEFSVVFEAWLLLWSCRIALWCAPFPRVLRFARFCAESIRSSKDLSADQAVEAIRRALRFTVRASCLSQALAGWIMLTRRGTAARMKIGVSSPEKHGFKAHAWLEAESRMILGDIQTGEGTAGLDAYHVIWTLPTD